MLLDLTRLTAPTTHLERSYAAEAVAVEDDYRVTSHVTLTMDVVRDDRERRFTLTGRLQATLGMTCSRCAEPVEFPVDAVFDLTYLPGHEEAAGDDVEVAEEDLGVAYYANEAIDLAQLMREQFYLALPMKPLCTEGCLGLCPTCGTNRNTAPCSCRPSWADPRLEGLKALLRTTDDHA